MSDANAKDAAETAPAKFTAQPNGADPLATRLVRELPHDRGILACRFAQQGRYLFAGARDNFVHRWDLDHQPPADAEAEEEAKPAGKAEVLQSPPQARQALAGHESWVRAMSLFPGDERLVTGDYVGRLIVWPALDDEPRPQCSFPAHEGSIRAVSVSADGRWIASAGNDRKVRIWDAGNPEKLQHELDGHESHVYHVAFHPGGERLVSADLKGRLLEWDVATGKRIREVDASLLHTYSEKYTVDVGGVRGMCFNGDGTRLACAGATGEKGIAHSGNARVLLFDWNTGEMLQELKPEKDEIATGWGVQFHPDGFIVASGGSRTGGYLWYWVPSEPIAFHTVKFTQRAPGFDLDLSPCGKTLAVANHDGTIRFWSVTPPEQTKEPSE